MLHVIRPRCNISSNGAVLRRRNEAVMGAANSLYVSGDAMSMIKDFLCILLQIKALSKQLAGKFVEGYIVVVAVDVAALLPFLK